MAIIASASSNRVPAPSGSHLARCFGVIDLGTQHNPQFGTTARKVMLQFELPSELHTWKEENGPEPFVVSREFSLSLSPKANLRPFLEGWRGRPFSEEELAKFDISVLAGQPCLINIIHENKGDKVFANIASVMKLPKAMGECPPAHNRVVVLSLDGDFSQEDFNNLPEWIRKKIEVSKEFKSITNDAAQGQLASGGSYHSGVDDSDIPFACPHYLTVGGW
jgi:hypothetical protein